MLTVNESSDSKAIELDVLDTDPTPEAVAQQQELNERARNAIARLDGIAKLAQAVSQVDNAVERSI